MTNNKWQMTNPPFDRGHRTHTTYTTYTTYMTYMTYRTYLTYLTYLDAQERIPTDSKTTSVLVRR
jgi:hypothetical protein